MSKFNVGDKVRSLVDQKDVVKGGVYEVVKVTEGGLYVNDAADEEYILWLNECELVAPRSPIRTVTRREIAPGVYGLLDIDRFSRSKVFVGLRTECGNRYVDMNATELREAAHILVQLAEVLEDE